MDGAGQRQTEISFDTECIAAAQLDRDLSGSSITMDLLPGISSVWSSPCAVNVFVSTAFVFYSPRGPLSYF